MVDHVRRRPIPSAISTELVELEFEREASEVIISARAIVDGRSVGFVLRMPKDRASVLGVNIRGISADEPDSNCMRCTLSSSTLQVSQ